MEIGRFRQEINKLVAEYNKDLPEDACFLSIKVYKTKINSNLQFDLRPKGRTWAGVGFDITTFPACCGIALMHNYDLGTYSFNPGFSTRLDKDKTVILIKKLFKIMKHRFGLVVIGNVKDRYQTEFFMQELGFKKNKSFINPNTDRKLVLLSKTL